MNEEVLDAVGELTNMIIGSFKTAAETVVGPLGLSVPTVIFGRSFISKSLGNKDWLVLPFKFGDMADCRLAVSLARLRVQGGIEGQCAATIVFDSMAFHSAG